MSDESMQEAREDPMRGRWADLDRGPVASAQMIQWHAPKTYEAIRDAVLSAPPEVLAAAMGGAYYPAITGWDDVDYLAKGALIVLPPQEVETDD